MTKLFMPMNDLDGTIFCEPPVVALPVSGEEKPVDGSQVSAKLVPFL